MKRWLRTAGIIFMALVAMLVASVLAVFFVPNGWLYVLIAWAVLILALVAWFFIMTEFFGSSERDAEGTAPPRSAKQVILDTRRRLPR